MEKTLRCLNDLCAFIKQERYEKHTSQSKLGEKTNLKQQYINLIEKGRVAPRLDMVLKIVHALDCELIIKKRG